MTTSGIATRSPLGGQSPADDRRFGARSEASLRTLLVVNPKATTVSARLKRLVVHALQSRYDVELAETAAPNHATALARDAVDASFDLVVAFGGDGTVNEAANGLAGSEVPLTILPGGSTNVVCRMLGIPPDIVDATEHLLALADGAYPHRIDLGCVNGRYFVSSGGVGIDADTTRWVDEHPPLKARAGPLFFSLVGIRSFYSQYAGRPTSLIVEVGGERIEGVSAIAQNSDPYTYFNSRPIRICDGERLDSGFFSMAVLRKARRRDAPSLARKLLSRRLIAADHNQIESLCRLQSARITAADPEHGRLPVQVDGDYIGDFTQIEFSIRPRSLAVVS